MGATGTLRIPTPTADTPWSSFLRVHAAQPATRALAIRTALSASCRDSARCWLRLVSPPLIILPRKAMRRGLQHIACSPVQQLDPPATPCVTRHYLPCSCASCDANAIQTQCLSNDTCSSLAACSSHTIYLLPTPHLPSSMIHATRRGRSSSARLGSHGAASRQGASARRNAAE